MQMKKQILTLVVAAFLLSGPNARADAMIGQNAPAFVAAALDGEAFDLSSLKGKVVVINFWATWCQQCGNELPALEAVWRQYRSQGLEVLSINADAKRRSDVEAITQYFSFPCAVMSSVSKNELVTLTSVPLTYVIGKDGKISNIFSPLTQPLNEATLGDEVKMLLAVKEEAKPDANKETKADEKK